MRMIAIVVMLALALLVVGGCMTLNHTVGDGGGKEKVGQKRQWYILFGLIPLNKVDGGKMSDGAKDYTIKSSYTPVDFLLNIFTGLVTIESQTVTVTK